MAFSSSPFEIVEVTLRLPEVWLLIIALTTIPPTAVTAVHNQSINFVNVSPVYNVTYC